MTKSTFLIPGTKEGKLRYSFMPVLFKYPRTAAASCIPS